MYVFCGQKGSSFCVFIFGKKHNCTFLFKNVFLCLYILLLGHILFSKFVNKNYLKYFRPQINKWNFFVRKTQCLRRILSFWQATKWNWSLVWKTSQMWRWKFYEQQGRNFPLQFFVSLSIYGEKDRVFLVFIIANPFNHNVHFIWSAIEMWVHAISLVECNERIPVYTLKSVCC